MLHAWDLIGLCFFYTESENQHLNFSAPESIISTAKLHKWPYYSAKTLSDLIAIVNIQNFLVCG